MIPGKYQTCGLSVTSLFVNALFHQVMVVLFEHRFLSLTPQAPTACDAEKFIDAHMPVKKPDSPKPFTRPRQCCRALTRTDRPRTFGYPCCGPCRFAGYRRHPGRRPRVTAYTSALLSFVVTAHFLRFRRARVDPSGSLMTQPQRQAS